MDTEGEGEDAMTLLAGGDAEVLVTVGVNTHLDSHVAVALDHLGRRLDALSVGQRTRWDTRGSCGGLAVWESWSGSA